MKDALAKLLKHKRLHGQRPENGTNVRNIVLELGSLLLRRGRHYPVLSEYLREYFEKDSHRFNKANWLDESHC